MFSHCLKASNTLRKQLFSTFGSAALFSLALVVIAACWSIYVGGEIVKLHSSQLMEFHVVDALKSSSRLMAEKLTARLSEVDSSVQLLVESVQDRIVGYPTLEGWEDGIYVPFVDSETETRKYPLAMPPVPMDWNISYTTIATNGTVLEQETHSTAEARNGNTTNTIDHDNSHHIRTRTQFGQRLAYYAATWDVLDISMDTASYHFSGSCNPKADPTSPDWVHSCLEWPMPNNQTFGGTIFPPSTHTGLYQSTGDLSVFMKPLFESRMDALRINIYFINSGAGATLSYPASPIHPMVSFKDVHFGDGNGDDGFYISNGCDWMANTNSRTGRPYGSPQLCHKKGTKVAYSEYNPLEEEWAPFYLDQIDKVGWFSPPCSKLGNETIVHRHQILKAGKAILDRL